MAQPPRTWEQMRTSIADRLERQTTLPTPRRTFAAVRPTTKTGVDLGLRIDGATPGGRLLDGSNTAGGGINLRVPLSSIDDLDDEAVSMLSRAYHANL